MEKERIQLGKNSRTIQQRNAGSANIMDNRPDGSRNYLSGHPLQRVEDDEEEDVLQGKLSAPVQRLEIEEDDEGVTQRMAGRQNAMEGVIQCFNMNALQAENPTAVSKFLAQKENKYSFKILSKTNQFAPIDIYHVSAAIYDPSRIGKRVTKRQAKGRPFSTFFYDSARTIYAIGVHMGSSSYYIKETDPAVPHNAFQKGMVVLLGEDMVI